MVYEEPVTAPPGVITLGSALYQHPFLVIGSLLTVLYVAWYKLVVVRTPLLYGGKERLRDHLLAHCPALSQPYKPTIWAWHYHGTTILRPLMQRLLPIHYERQLLRLSDGGQVGLDWARVDDGKDNTVLLILPGLSGGSEINYVQHFVRDGLEAGYSCVVFNQRGMCDIPLTSPRMVSANLDDLEAVLDDINKQHPDSSIIGLGISLGGIILTNYLHSTGSRSRISACMTVSTPWDVEMSRQSLEEKLLNRLLYVNFLLGRLKNVVRKNITELRKHPSVNIDRALKAQTLTEFDGVLTAPSYGFESRDQYYEQSSIHDKVKNIQFPFVCIMAMDDPFSPPDCIPIADFESNPNTVLLLTRHGGHFGFIEGVYPRDRSWMDRIFSQFIITMKKW